MLERTGSAICNLPFRCDVILKTAPPPERSSAAQPSCCFVSIRLARLASPRLDLTFRLSFGLGFCFLDSFRYVALRLIVYSFVSSYFASSARVDSIIIETNLNFYGHRDDMKEPVGLAGWRVQGQGEGQVLCELMKARLEKAKPSNETSRAEMSTCRLLHSECFQNALEPEDRRPTHSLPGYGT